MTGTRLRGPLLPWTLIACLIVAAAVSPLRAAAAAVSQSFAVVDGDTLELNGETVRLYGIDAPELGQVCLNGGAGYRCGFESALILKKLVGNGPVECRPTPVDASDPGQICSVGLVDLAEALLRQGYAVAQDSAFAVYRRAESEAKRSGLGIWRGEFAVPAEWRAGRRLEVKGEGPRQYCDVKGLIGEAGQRVYLVPSDPEYEGIVIDQARGERFFCSDDQAELAGWKRWPKSAVQQRAGSAGQRSN